MIEIFFKLKSENFLYFNVGYRGCRAMLFEGQLEPPRTGLTYMPNFFATDR